MGHQPRGCGLRSVRQSVQCGEVMGLGLRHPKAARPDQQYQHLPDAPLFLVPASMAEHPEGDQQLKTIPSRRYQRVPGASLFSVSVSATEHPEDDQKVTDRLNRSVVPSDLPPQRSAQAADGECATMPEPEYQRVPGAPLFSGSASMAEPPEGDQQLTTMPDRRCRRVPGASLFSD